MSKSKKKKGTKQTLEFVEEPKKFRVKPIKCKSKKQKEFLEAIESHTITLCNGIPGSGKTFLACYAALKMLEKQQIDRIVLVKSVTTLPGEDLGYLPGSMNSKIDPFMVSFIGNIDKLIGEEMRKKLFNDNKLVFQPLSFIRGISIDNAIVLVDEVQNLTTETFKSIITRIGSGSKYIIMGDSEQVDLKQKSRSVLSKLMELFQDSESVGTISFKDEDCVRNPIIPYLLNKIKEIE